MFRGKFLSGIACLLLGLTGPGKAYDFPAGDPGLIAMCEAATVWCYMYSVYDSGKDDIVLKNEAEPGEMPYAYAKLAWALYDGHPVFYNDYCMEVELPSGTIFFPSAYESGTVWKIDPLKEGWSGTMRITLVGPGGHTHKLSASWNFEKPNCKNCKGAVACRVAAELGSVKLHIPVGNNKNGRETYELEYHSESLVNGGAETLKYFGKSGSNGAALTFQGNVISSIATGGGIARVIQEPTVDDPKRFRVAVSYDAANPDTTIYRQVIVEKLADVLRVVDIVNGKTYVYDYSNPSPDTWVLEESSKRKTTKTVTETATERTTREKVDEKNLAGNWQRISDHYTREEMGYFGMQTVRTVVDPDGVDLVSTFDYYGSTATTGPNGDTRGRGRLKTETLPTGLVRNYQYLDNDPYNAAYTTVDVIKEHYASTANGKETRIHRKSTTWTSDLLEEVWVLGNLVSKKEIVGTQTSRITRIYPAAGAAPLVTTEVFDTNKNTPLLSETTHPDGTVVRKEEWMSGGLLNEQEFSGVRNTGSGHYLWRGTQQVRKINAKGEIQQSISYQIHDGVAYRLEEKQLAQQDAQGRPLKYDVLHGNNTAATYSELLEYCCCGLSKVTGQDGIPTQSYFDALGREWKTNRNGIANETIFDGRTTHYHRFPEATPSATSGATADNEVSNVTVNVAGDTISSQARSPKDGTMITTTTVTGYTIGSTVGRMVVQTLPQTADDQGVLPTVTMEYYKDGQRKAMYGPLVVDRKYEYGSMADGLTITQSLVATGGSSYQMELSQLDWAGRRISLTYAGDKNGDSNPDRHLFEYDTGSRLKKSVDPDGVTQLASFDLASGTQTSALDLNGNGVIDLNVDRGISIEKQGVGLSAGQVIFWSEQATRLSGAEVRISRSESTPDGLSTVQTRFGGDDVATQSSVTQFLTSAAGSWNTTITNPDGTFEISRYQGGLFKEQQGYALGGASLYLKSFTYDAQQRVTGVQDTRGPATAYGYVSAMVSQVASTTIGTRETLMGYDERGRNVLMDEPDSLTSTGATVTNQRIISYWPHGGVRQESGTPGYQVSYGYDDAHRLSAMTTYGTSTAVTRWLYDADRGWYVGKRYNSPSPGQGHGESYAYTVGGRLQTRTLARGIEISYGYDVAGMPTITDYSDGTATVSVLERDQVGRVMRLSDASGERKFGYNDWGGMAEEHCVSGILAGWRVRAQSDSIGRLAGLSARQGDTGLDQYHVEYGYNASGFLASVQNEDKKAFMTYDATRQKLEQVAIAKDDGPILYGTTVYDALGGIERISYHNGQAGEGAKVYSDYRYQRDSFGNVQNVQMMDGTFWRYGYNSSGEVVEGKRQIGSSDYVRGQSFTWAYDGIGNRQSSARGGDASGGNLRQTTYATNILNQYTALQNPDGIDVNGIAAANAMVTVNGLAANRQSDFFHRELTGNNTNGPVWKGINVADGTNSKSGSILIPSSSQNLTYDVDGNLTSDGVYSYTWDGENRLVEIEVLDSVVLAGVPYQRMQYVYDAQWRRVECTRFDQKNALNAAELTRYLWANWRCLVEMEESGILKRSMIWGGGRESRMNLGDGNGALLWMIDGISGEMHCCQYDAIGNVVGLSSDTGEQTAIYLYNAYGSVLEQSGRYSQSNPFRFGTKQLDAVVNLYYFGYRYYNSGFGRWVNRDPIDENGGVNLYGMVGNNSVNYLDELGLSTKKEIDDKNNFRCTVLILVGHNGHVIEAGQKAAENSGSCWGIAGWGCGTKEGANDLNDELKNIVPKDVVLEVPMVARYTIPQTLLNKPKKTGEMTDDAAGHIATRLGVAGEGLGKPDWVDSGDWETAPPYRKARNVLEDFIKKGVEKAQTLCGSNCGCGTVEIRLVVLPGSPLSDDSIKSNMKNWAEWAFKYAEWNDGDDEFVWRINCDNKGGFLEPKNKTSINK